MGERVEENRGSDVWQHKTGETEEEEPYLAADSARTLFETGPEHLLDIVPVEQQFQGMDVFETIVSLKFIRRQHNFRVGLEVWFAELPVPFDCIALFVDHEQGPEEENQVSDAEDCVDS